MSDPVTNRDTLEIVNNKGFQHIADAIRCATIIPQNRRILYDDRTYEIRYDLGPELIRKARHKDEFLIALSEFLFKYNAETVQEDEKAIKDIAKKEGHKPRPLTSQDRKERHLRYMTGEDDLKAIVDLVDNHAPEVVGTLLVACGYSFKGAANKMPKQEGDTMTPEEEEELENDTR